MADDNDSTSCAACGKVSDDLKRCDACKLVKYCNRECQATHRRAHKKTCKKRAAELFNEQLFKQPPANDDCPVCFLPLPLESSGGTYQPCCGNLICSGCMCVMEEDVNIKHCPFCRAVLYIPREDFLKRLSKRIEVNDAEAIFMLAGFHMRGEMGVQQDTNKALQLFHNAAELGSPYAHAKLGSIYQDSSPGSVGAFYGVESDIKKAAKHMEQAAILGDAKCRFLLAILQMVDGKDERGAIKHIIISARQGLDIALDHIKQAFFDQHLLVTKEVYAETLRAWKDSSDEMKSEQRTRAEALREQDIPNTETFENA